MQPVQRAENETPEVVLQYADDLNERVDIERLKMLDTGEYILKEQEHCTCDQCGCSCWDLTSATSERGRAIDICIDCRDNNYRCCDDCCDYIHENDIRYSNSNDCYYCNSCYDDRGLDDDDEEEGNTYREPDNDEKLRSKVFGQIIKHKRTFGVELECGFNDYDKLKSFVESTEHFGVVSDGSVSCNHYSREIVSPILQGQAGESAILKVCKDLNESRATVDKSCGYHLHLGAKELKASFSKMRALIAFYMIYDKLFFQYLPASREQNRYCIPLAKKYGEYFGNETVRKEIDKKLYGTSNAYQIKREKNCKYADCRYSSVNLHSIYYRGTLEVRSHSGTLDSIKVLEWANLHGLILEKIISGKIDYQYSESCKGDTIDILEKKLFDILRLKESSQQYFRTRRAKFQRDTTGNSVQDSDEQLVRLDTTGIIVSMSGVSIPAEILNETSDELVNFINNLQTGNSKHNQ